MKAVKLFTLFLCIMLPALAWANIGEAQQLTQHYKKMQRETLETAPRLPFNIHSSEIDNRLSADVYGLIKRPFDSVTSALIKPVSWCEFMPLNLNIKSCTYQQNLGKTSLTFYAGRKYYEAPEAAYQLNYHYQVAALSNNYMKVVLDYFSGLNV